MKLSFRRKQSLSAGNMPTYPLPPELTPQSSRRPAWLRWVILAIVVIIIVGLIAWGIIALVSDSGNPAKAPTKPHSSTSTSQPAPKGSTKTTPSSGSVGSSRPSGSSSSNSSSSSQTALSNTGPGDTLTLFAVVVLVGFTAHQIVLRRRRA